MADTDPTSRADTSEPEQEVAPHGASGLKAHFFNWKHILSTVLAIVVIVAVFGFAFPRFASYEDAWKAIESMHGWQIALLVAFALVRLTFPGIQMMTATPGLHLGTAFMATNWGAALSNTIPAGGALGVGVTYQMLMDVGIRVAAVTRQFIVTGIWNDLVRLAMPVATLAALAVVDEATSRAVEFAVIGFCVFVVLVVLFAVILRSESAAAAIGRFAARCATWALRLVHHAPVTGWDQVLVDFDRSTGQMVKQRWLRLTAATLLQELGYFTLLLMSVRFTGISASEISPVEVLAAYVISRVLQIIPITPGGLGVVQAGIAGTLAAFGAPNDQTAAAVLVYTALTWLPPIPVGIGSFLVWSRTHKRRGPRSAQPEPAPAAT